MRNGMVALAILFSASLAVANPRVARDVAKINAIPRLWLEQATPTPGSHKALLRVFAQEGVDFDPATVEMIERAFDRFAPVMVEAQSPPWALNPGLQRWFRAHANHAQGDGMKAALREWLDSDANPDSRSPASNRMYVIEALGDWHDEKALPRLRSLQDTPILRAAIRRIEDPKHADPIVVRADGLLQIQRSIEELDSIVVVSYDPTRMENTTWRPVPRSERRIYAALGNGARVRRVNERGLSTLVGTIYLSFRDGREIRLAANGDGWRLNDNGRVESYMDIVCPNLDQAIDGELERVGILPKGPRFVEESVTMWIHKDEMRILGVYEFEGKPKRGKLTLEYPFPTDSTLGVPRLDMIHLDTDSPSGSAAHVDLKSDSLPWHIAIEPGDATRYRLTVGYRQEIYGRSATYLLRSALEWKRPLRKAFLYVSMDQDLGVPNFEYAFEKGPGGRYAFQASPFRPSRDLVVRW